MSASVPPSMPTVLENIIARKREEIAERCQHVPLSTVMLQAQQQPACRGFVQAVERRLAAQQPAVIAEIKKASPSKGIIREPFIPVDIAESYAQAGATCLSVLTDIDFFQGADHYLTEVRHAVDLPVIRKDFIVDEYQIYEARAIGADCILLIVAVLSADRLQQLNDCAHALGMDVLVEVHNAQELDVALELPNRLIGINNRNLHTFETCLDTTFELLDRIDDSRIVVTESGIHTREHVQAMRQQHVHSFLIGEALMRAEDPGQALQTLFT